MKITETLVGMIAALLALSSMAANARMPDDGPVKSNDVIRGAPGDDSDPVRLDLSGQWEFALDPDNQGIAESWQEKPFTARIRLPGCLQEQGFGFPPGPNTKWWGEGIKPQPWEAKYHQPGNFKLQAFLTPERHYIGAAWYVREFDVPAAWKGKHIRLYLERAHWQTQVWLDGRLIGVQDSLATPHLHDLGVLAEGHHRISIRVDNSEIVHVGSLAHSVSEQTAGTWNGIVGRIELQTLPALSIESLRVISQVKAGKIVMSLELQNRGPAATRATLAFSTKCISSNKDAFSPAQKPVEIQPGTHPVQVELPLLQDAALWDEFDPNLHELTVSLTTKNAFDQRTVRYGLRDFTVHGTQFAINGVTTFVRGNTDCAVFPKTGYAPMDVESWRKLFRTYKEFGLNMARFHSWCPPAAAFEAADEMGIYLAPEACEWAVVTRPDQKEFLTRESLRILREYGCHPSFVMMALGNEHGGDKPYFHELIETWKSFDSSRRYTIKSNSTTNPSNIEFEVARWAGKGKAFARYHTHWPPLPNTLQFITKPPQTSIDWREAVTLYPYPLIQHETSQICAYPNPHLELPKFTGYLKARYLEIQLDQLKERGLEGQIDRMVEASGKWQIELTREEFEAGFRTPGLAGFHWLSLGDFTGQTTAPVGLTDAFHDPKSYVNPAQVRRWNAPTVLLARMPKRVFTNSDTLAASLEVSHYGKTRLQLNDLTAILRSDGGKVIQTWKLPAVTLDQGSAQHVGDIALPLAGITAPAKLNLLVQSKDKGLINDWNLWVYPDTPAVPFTNNITVVREWNESTRKLLNDGRTVLLLPKIGTLRGNLPGCFIPFYWTSFGTLGGASSAAGLLIDPTHPLFSQFPTDSHVNWQWWDLLTRCQPMILDSYDSKHAWPKDHFPLLQPIDTWKINRKLALVTEAKFGRARLLICSINLEDDLDQRPATRQFRKSLIDYMNSDAFDPQLKVTDEMLGELFAPDNTGKNPSIEREHNLPTEG